ncbi:uncharacterized protein Z519_06128 [Cladophialophora bantiana CBS 173.52]|uniref:Glycosyl hydrolase family 32 C-terminal domain-containing protein n=1 Tax=Cladophialophora bantiana (strain ATCC 10958 / CBS 173.52 / CDC B-1940 / NIH 8579) TaxID=1442370 RepID=A0A0D2HJU1_CLAB1|nr:uncharacterized protein Z519_06128 [Cladophialophora bantiana CBS 173.52]KIW93523.1 hypothetical protein Z519_06128 [Cladophialophora bantiana CBS 173.52]
MATTHQQGFTICSSSGTLVEMNLDQLFGDQCVGGMLSQRIWCTGMYLKHRQSNQESLLKNGCLIPTNSDGKAGARPLTVFYTGVSRLPLHYTLPYIRQTETLAAAQSLDGGQTWTKVTKNPILLEPPAALDVTGWRDPFIATWPAMAKLLGHGKSQFYGMISGGIRDRSPTAFLYAINPSNPAEWTFLSCLVEVGLSHSTSRWSGDMGINWECACFMTLQDGHDGESRHFVIAGCEGSKAGSTHCEESSFTQYPQSPTKFPRPERSLQWMCGALQTTTATTPDTGHRSTIPKMHYKFGGRFDYGLLYAATTFHEPLSDKQIVWAWVTEEDLPQHLVDEQGWSGMISLPREVGLLTVRGVTGVLRSRLQDITSMEFEPEEESGKREQQTFRIRTLGISPAPFLQSLRNSAREIRLAGHSLHLTSEGDMFMDLQTNRFELVSKFSLSHACKRIGLSIFHDGGHAQRMQQNEISPLPSSEPATRTTILFIPESETIRIDRSVRDLTDIIHDDGINTTPETAPFTLFTFLPVGEDGDGHLEPEKETETEPKIEDLELHVFFDESVLEVFVNSRCAIATRVYPSGKRCLGVRFWAEDAEDEGQERKSSQMAEEIESRGTSCTTQLRWEQGSAAPEGESAKSHRRSGKRASSSRSRLLHAVAWDGLRAR